MPTPFSSAKEESCPTQTAFWGTSWVRPSNSFALRSCCYVERLLPIGSRGEETTGETGWASSPILVLAGTASAALAATATNEGTSCCPNTFAEATGFDLLPFPPSTRRRRQMRDRSSRSIWASLTSQPPDQRPAVMAAPRELPTTEREALSVCSVAAADSMTDASGSTGRRAGHARGADHPTSNCSQS